MLPPRPPPLLSLPALLYRPAFLSSSSPFPLRAFFDNDKEDEEEEDEEEEEEEGDAFRFFPATGVPAVAAVAAAAG